MEEVSQFLPNFTALHLRRQPFSFLSPRKSEIILPFTLFLHLFLIYFVPFSILPSSLFPPSLFLHASFVFPSPQSSHFSGLFLVFSFSYTRFSHVYFLSFSMKINIYLRNSVPNNSTGKAIII